ncbi:T9SS type A sorting domain-containing protein, partial [Polaribacter sp.]|uniref:T9SS type A sorting domain-containing protein n=1 Tax=Polaribacter sp. TaxID=1920175 RepID=UPI003F4C49F9
IYPNPVNNGLVTIKSLLAGVKNIALFDAIGRNVLKTELTAEALDVSELGAGLYLLKVTIGDRSATHKLIIN